MNERGREGDSHSFGSLVFVIKIQKVYLKRKESRRRRGREREVLFALLILIDETFREKDERKEVLFPFCLYFLGLVLGLLSSIPWLPFNSNPVYNPMNKKWSSFPTRGWKSRNIGSQIVACFLQSLNIVLSTKCTSSTFSIQFRNKFQCMEYSGFVQASMNGRDVHPTKCLFAEHSKTYIAMPETRCYDR